MGITTSRGGIADLTIQGTSVVSIIETVSPLRNAKTCHPLHAAAGAPVHSDSVSFA